MKNNENEEKSKDESNSIQKVKNLGVQENDKIYNKTQDYKDPHISYKNISSSIKMQQKFFGKESSPTIFDEKLKKKTSNQIQKVISGSDELKNINKDDFLKVRKINKISDNDFEILKNEIISREKLDLLYNDIINCDYLPLNEIDFSANVGCMLPFAFLIESLFNNNIITIEEMNDRYELFKKYIYNYRPIKGDGNCFYRAVIFRYFEIVILNKKIELLKNIIKEMYESFNSNEIRSRIRIKYGFVLNTRLVLLIMIIILNLLEEGKISEAHYFYVKSFVIEDSFDYGLIIYYRYIFYLYIKKNENKIYLENFPIKIGNLLPSNYETEQGMFLFNKFYYLYLLSMFKDAEKIIIHLTPFVLGINLDVIIFNDNEDKTIKNMIYSGESEYTFKEDKIFVLNINGHYELLYSENDNDKNKDIFQNYINDYYNINFRKVSLNDENNSQQNDNKDEEEKYQNNIIYESSSHFLNKKSIEENEKVNNIDNSKEENKEDNEVSENKNKYNVQIKIINKTAKKPKKSFSIEEEEKNGNNNIISDKFKYSEVKDIKYQNLIQNKNNEENNNKVENNDESNQDKNIQDKKINIERTNLIEKMNNEIDNDKKFEEELNDKNSFINDDEKNQVQLTNIISNSENKNNIKKYNKDIEGLCEVCSKNYFKKNEDEIFHNICQDCLKKNIINKLYPIFLSYMEESISSKIHELAFKNYFNEFIENKIEIFDQNISIKETLQLLDNNYKTNLEMHPVFQEMKKNFCIFCLGDLNKEKYEIPCKCNFCCIDHIKKYFHLKNNFRYKSNYICICSHEYTNEDIYNIGIFFYLNKLYSLKDDTIDFLNQNYLEKQCCFCSNSIGINNRKRIKIKDFEDEIILGDTNKLRHFICSYCVYQYRNNVETFNCFICNKNHIVLNLNQEFYYS